MERFITIRRVSSTSSALLLLGSLAVAGTQSESGTSGSRPGLRANPPAQNNPTGTNSGHNPNDRATRDAQDQRTRDGRGMNPDMTDRTDSRNMNPQQIAAAMRSSTMTLSQAILAAESHCNGKAIDARARVGSSQDWDQNASRNWNQNDSNQRGGEQNRTRDARGTTDQNREADRDQTRNNAQGRNDSQNRSNTDRNDDSSRDRMGRDSTTRDTGTSGNSGSQTQGSSADRDTMNSRGSMGATGSATGLIFDITCLSDNGQINVVSVDGRNGSVLGSKGWDGTGQATRDGSRDSRHMMGDRKIVKATSITDREVVDASNQKVAVIDDLVINTSSGRIRYAVLDLTGGTDRLVTVPWSALTHEGGKCRVNMASGRSLESAPAFNRNAWPDMSNERFGRQLGDYYGTGVNDDSTPSGTTGPVARLTDVVGTDVRSNGNDDLGKVEDLAIDASSGQISYVVITSGGFLGFNEKYIAVPWDSLNRSSDDTWTLAMDKDRLKNAPMFDKNEWPDMSDPQFDRRTRDFYGQRSGSAR